MNGLDIGPPKERGQICTGDFEFVVDPFLIKLVGKPMLYNNVTREYFTIDRIYKKTGQMKMTAIEWKVNPFTPVGMQ